MIARMEKDDRAAYITRESILRLLTDDEVAKVSTSETKAHLEHGDEYLDLEQLNLGVLRSASNMTPMGHVLPRKAVHANTWTKILAHVTAAARA
jgi:hypothetical protein